MIITKNQHNEYLFHDSKVNNKAAHLRTFLKECGSYARTIYLGKGIHLRIKFIQEHVTFAHARLSQANGTCMFALVRL